MLAVVIQPLENTSLQHRELASFILVVDHGAFGVAIGVRRDSVLVRAGGVQYPRDIRGLCVVTFGSGDGASVCRTSR